MVNSHQESVIDAQTFLDLRAKHLGQKRWCALIVEKPVMRDLYLMYTPQVNMDNDLVDCATRLDLDDDRTQYYLKLIWRALMRNYAFADAWDVGALLAKAHEHWTWRFWRGLQGYSLPRLWVAIIVGHAVLLGSDTLRTLLGSLSARWPSRLLAFLVIGVLVYYLGMTDVQRRVGRDWHRVLARSTALLLAGIFYASICFGVHLWGDWYANRGSDPARAGLLAACALLLAHLVQLFWTEGSVGDPL